MKKILFILLVTISTCMVANAQKTEIAVSYGGYTQMDACNNHDSWHGVNTAWGALNLGVNFHVAPKIWLGPSYTFSSTSTKGNPHSSIAYHALLLNGRYYYYQSGPLKMYAHFGIGTVISHFMPYEADNYNKAYFAVQVSPVGFDIDINRSLKFFGELGFGAQGLAQIGLRIGL